MNDVCGMTYGPALIHHEGTMCNYSRNHWGKHGRTEDGPEPVKPKRPVKMRFTESEAARLLDLLAQEEHNKAYAADQHYGNGTGFETKCAQAREASEAAVTIAERLRKSLAKTLETIYVGDDDE